MVEIMTCAKFASVNDQIANVSATNSNAQYKGAGRVAIPTGALFSESVVMSFIASFYDACNLLHGL